MHSRPNTTVYDQALAHMRRRNWRAALDILPLPAVLTAAHAQRLILRAHCFWGLEDRGATLEAAMAAQRLAAADPAILDAVGTLFSLVNDQDRALEALDRAVELAPGDPRFRYNRASVRRFVGDLEGAEADYDVVIAARPGDYEAYLNRSELRAQTPERNHITQLEARLPHAAKDWRAGVQIRYALAKECEDLGRYEQSFQHLRAGADLRRAHMTYDVSTDVATAGWIVDAFPGSPPAVAPASPHTETRAPIFVVGLPRSGTTLVERILSNHSTIAGAGELNCFALSVVDAATRKQGKQDLPRRELVYAAASLDFPALGGEYLRRAQSVLGVDGRFIDKMPLNYLYCGLIRRTLPEARIIHVTRHPMAVGYAMYKTLFKDGYPFSYDLNDIARYYLAYRKVVDHWRGSLHDSWLEVSYENLVADQEGETRRLLSHCGLDWQDACLHFHKNPKSSTTASATQVRRPIYRTSLARWRHFGPQLEPLRRALIEGGVTV